MRSRTALGVLGIATAVAAYVKIGRPWQLTWGATREEVCRPLPGDDLVPRPTFNATRAVSIDAPPERIWPWLVQVGTTRAGWYSYDLLETSRVRARVGLFLNSNTCGQEMSSR